MSNKENNIESTDQSNLNAQASTEEENEEEFLEGFKAELEEMYESRVNFKNSVNQYNNRHVNLALVLTQFFSRYSVNQIIVFLAVSTSLVAVQGLQALTGKFPQLTLVTGFLMTILMIAFAVVTLKNIVAALTDIRRIKRGFCCIGYQIVKKKDKNDKSSDDQSHHPIIAYKDSANMIRTLTFPEEQFKKYCLLPVLILFLDNNIPHGVTIFEDLPKDVSYEYKNQTFTQEWKELVYTLIPIAMIVLYAISMYLCYIAYTTLNQ